MRFNFFPKSVIVGANHRMECAVVLRGAGDSGLESGTTAYEVLNEFTRDAYGEPC